MLQHIFRSTTHITKQLYQKFSTKDSRIVLSSPDVIKLSIKYLSPFELLPFFKIHNINFNLQFSYDASSHELSCETFNHIFDQFPNIIIIGIYLNNLNDVQNIHKKLDAIRTLKMEDLDSQIDMLFCHDKLKSIEIRYCNVLTDIQNLSHCSALQHIKLYSCNDLQNVLGLSKCKKLRSILLTGAKLGDISEIGNLKRLRRVVFERCQLFNIPNLSNCTKLKHVNLFGSSIQCMDGLSECTNIKVIKLEECFNLTSIDALSGCKKLHTLDLRSCYKLMNINALIHCEKLENLNLSHCSSINDVTMLNNFPALNCVWLYGCKKNIGLCQMQSLNFHFDENRKILTKSKNNYGHQPDFSTAVRKGYKPIHKIKR